MSDKIRKYVLPNLPYLFVFWFFSKIGTAYRIALGTDFGTKLMGMLDTFPKAFETYWPGLGGIDLLVGLAGAAGVYLLIQSKIRQAKKFRRDAEYGTARFGTKEDIKPFVDPKFQNNVILTGTEFLTMNTRPKIPANARNLNACVIGSSGSGKTRFWLTPQLLQAHSSYVVVDPKGGTLDQCGRFLQREKYRVRVFNSIDFSKSMHYNPLAYIKTESDVLKFVTALIANTKGDGKEGDEFWTKAETLLYCALVAYIVFEGPEEERNMNTLVEMINSMEVREDDESFKNAVDYMFDGLAKRNPQHFAVRQYAKYKLASGKTAKSILISCGARLAPFDIAELREIMSYDELELDKLGDEKTALFFLISCGARLAPFDIREVRELMEDDEMELDTIGDEKTILFLIMSDTDTTFNFILAMIQSQLINLLCDRADDKYGGRLPVHVRLILDEFANIGQIPNFDKLIATIRSREISASIILQSQSQLKAIYKDAAEIISDNCDSVLFLSGRGKNAKEISDALGKETIDSFNTSENRGSQTSHGLNYQKLGKALMSEDEIAIMDGGKCILQLRGVRPFFSEKFDITKHPHYKYLADADKKNTFDVDRFLSTLRRKRQQVVAQDEPFDLYEIDLSDEDAAAE